MFYYSSTLHLLSIILITTQHTQPLKLPLNKKKDIYKTLNRKVCFKSHTSSSSCRNKITLFFHSLSSCLAGIESSQQTVGLLFLLLRQLSFCHFHCHLHCVPLLHSYPQLPRLRLLRLFLFCPRCCCDFFSFAAILCSPSIDSGFATKNAPPYEAPAVAPAEAGTPVKELVHTAA